MGRAVSGWRILGVAALLTALVPIVEVAFYLATRRHLTGFLYSGFWPALIEPRARAILADGCWAVKCSPLFTFQGVSLFVGGYCLFRRLLPGWRPAAKGLLFATLLFAAGGLPASLASYSGWRSLHVSRPLALTLASQLETVALALLWGLVVGVMLGGNVPDRTQPPGPPGNQFPEET